MHARSTPFAAALVIAAFSGLAAAQSPLTPAFTYQGELKASGVPSSGTFDFQFKLFNALTGGTQVGSTQQASQAVQQGRFTSSLNFGGNAFDGSRRWLEIAVRPTGAPSFTTLTPRQELTASPYALTADRLALPFSASASTDAGLIPTGLLQIFQSGTANAIMATGGSTGAAFYGVATGTGDALRVHSNGGPSSGSAVHATSDDFRAGTFEIDNPSSPHIALYATSNGTGHAIQGYMTGSGKAISGYNNGTTGNAGFFRIGNDANASDALYAETLGDGRAFQAWAAGGGTAVHARSNGGPALNIASGYVKVQGAGVGTPTPVFTHQVSSGNRWPNGVGTYISHSLLNGDPNAIVLVTIRNEWSGNTNVTTPVAALWDSSVGQWGIYSIHADELPIGAKFHVLVIKP